MNNQVREFLRSKIENGYFSGASVIFGKPFEKLVEVHEGMISSSIDRPIQASTLFDLQSITKSVATSALFLKLLQDGKVKLSDTVGKHLPQTEDLAPSMHEITFKHLLTHSSGLSDGDLYGDFKAKEELWTKMLSAKPTFEPGTSIEYTDLGYRILGKAIEKITGMDLQSASQSLIWKPMNLKSITYTPPDKTKTAATPDAHGIIDDEQAHFLGGVLGCDGVFSNAEDLFTLMSSLLTAKHVFSKETLALLKDYVATSGVKLQSFFDTLAFGPKNLGWEINHKDFSYAGKFANPFCLEKAGGAGTFIWMDQESGFICVYLTNHGKPKPFDDVTWNLLLKKVAPDDLSNILYANK